MIIFNIMSVNITNSLISYIKNVITPSSEKCDELTNAIKENKVVHENGVISMGLCDTSDFALWKIFGANIPIIRDYFGPIIVITNHAVAEEILKVAKNTTNDSKHPEEGYCIGNRSTKIIKKQVGTNNLFGCNESETHRMLRIGIKNSLNSYFGDNVYSQIQKIMLSHVKNWLIELSCEKSFILQEAIDFIVSTSFCVILLNKNPDEKYIKDIKKTFKSFSERVSSPNPFKQLINYLMDSSEDEIIDDGLCDIIQKNIPDIPNCGKETITMLEKVGFGNLHSVLCSLFYRISTNEQYVINKLNKEIVVNIQDDITFNNISIRKNNMEKFFFETCRLAPPVWLQARKTGELGLQVNGISKIAPYSLILISNFIIGRNIRKTDPHVFDPDKIIDNEHSFFNPFSFSSSPNSCVGRHIAIPIIELILGELINNYKLNLIEGNDEYNGDVALKFKNKIICKLIKK